MAESRPLTAADRMPEEGDVLLNGTDAVIFSPNDFAGPSLITSSGGFVNVGSWDIAGPVPLPYIWRKDGGPVVVEEG